MLNNLDSCESGAGVKWKFELGLFMVDPLGPRWIIVFVISNVLT